MSPPPTTCGPRLFGGSGVEMTDALVRGSGAAGFGFLRWTGRAGGGLARYVAAFGRAGAEG